VINFFEKIKEFILGMLGLLFFLILIVVGSTIIIFFYIVICFVVIISFLSELFFNKKLAKYEIKFAKK
jgi:hypothetical protein